MVLPYTPAGYEEAVLLPGVPSSAVPKIAKARGLLEGFYCDWGSQRRTRTGGVKIVVSSWKQEACHQSDSLFRSVSSGRQ